MSHFGTILEILLSLTTNLIFFTLHAWKTQFLKNLAIFTYFLPKLISAWDVALSRKSKIFLFLIPHFLIFCDALNPAKAPLPMPLFYFSFITFLLRAEVFIVSCCFFYWSHFSCIKQGARIKSVIRWRITQEILLYFFQ